MSLCFCVVIFVRFPGLERTERDFQLQVLHYQELHYYTSCVIWLGVFEYETAGVLFHFSINQTNKPGIDLQCM